MLISINNKWPAKILTAFFMLFLIAACSPSTSNPLPVVATYAGETIPESFQDIQWEYKVLSMRDMAIGPFYNLSATTETAGQNGIMIENSINPELQARMNELGEQGWELVGFTGDAEGISTVMIFKRLRK